MTADLAAFYAERLDEDERVAGTLAGICRGPGPLRCVVGYGGPAAEAFLAHFTARRMTREVAAGRALLAAREKARAALDAALPGDYHRNCAAMAAWDMALCQRVTVYEGHPDYEARRGSGDDA